VQCPFQRALTLEAVLVTNKQTKMTYRKKELMTTHRGGLSILRCALLFFVSVGVGSRTLAVTITGGHNDVKLVAQAGGYSLFDSDDGSHNYDDSYGYDYDYNYDYNYEDEYNSSMGKGSVKGPGFRADDEDADEDCYILIDIGHGSGSDLDCDGYSDDYERAHGSDPRNPLSKPGTGSLDPQENVNDGQGVPVGAGTMLLLCGILMYGFTIYTIEKKKRKVII
jgi:hypothetical protein